MMSVNLLLSGGKFQTNYGPGSSSLDHRERWPCMVHSDLALSVARSLTLAHTRNGRTRGGRGWFSVCKHTRQAVTSVLDMMMVVCVH